MGESDVEYEKFDQTIEPIHTLTIMVLLRPANRSSGSGHVSSGLFKGSLFSIRFVSSLSSRNLPGSVSDQVNIEINILLINKINKNKIFEINILTNNI